MRTVKGSDVRPGVPLASLGLRLFCVAGVDNVHCQGVGCIRTGVPLASLGLRLFCVAGVGQCALPRGRMYAPGFRWRPWVSASFAWQAWDNVHCQGVGCTPRGSAGVPGSPPLLRGRRGTMCTAKGSDVRPGVPLASLGLRLFCVAGVGQCALPRGRMYAPGFRWRPWVSASFAWQAWDNVHCQGVGCTPRGSAGVPGSPPLLRGRRGTMCIAKGSDVRPGVPLASLGLRLFCVAGVGQCALPRGWMHAPGFRWRPWVSASFAWQAWDNVHCQGVGCTPRGSAGVPGSPPLLRGRRGTMCTVKGSDVRPGVPLASLGLRLFCVAGVGQCALPRGRMYAPGFRWRPWVSASFAGVGQCALSRGRMYGPEFRWRPWVSASFAWQAWDNVHCQGRMYAPGFRWRPWVSASFAWQAWGNVRCQGVGCTSRGSAGVPGSPPLLRGRRGAMCAAKGLDARPGVPLASLGLRLFCVAGMVLLLTHLTSLRLTSPHLTSLMHSLTNSLTPSLAPSLPPSVTHSLTHFTHSHIPHSHTPHSHHSLTLSFTHLYTHIHTHKLIHHHPSITLILPLPFLIFYAQSKSREVGNMWGYPVL